MDSAYDAKTIISFIKSNDRVPVIDPNKRKNNSRPPPDPAKKERYKIRSVVERANAHLKDCLLPKALYVKGYIKVFICPFFSRPLPGSVKIPSALYLTGFWERLKEALIYSMKNEKSCRSRRDFSLDWKFILSASLRLALQSVLLYSKPSRGNSMG
jgi:hypothetical protein